MIYLPPLVTTLASVYHASYVFNFCLPSDLSCWFSVIMQRNNILKIHHSNIIRNQWIIIIHFRYLAEFSMFKLNNSKNSQGTQPLMKNCMTTDATSLFFTSKGWPTRDLIWPWILTYYVLFLNCYITLTSQNKINE